ncbi:heme/hemin ABC transporter substrate-binding protein [Zunongwangia sp.]|uniref:heme/hemin ABC transporter substrate-binding protein n=1 Tax=Zunongwangia sp. TaxID=1965325 RepID=UPI003AA9B9FA
MKFPKVSGVILFILITITSCKNATNSAKGNTEEHPKKERIISLNGTLTEIISAVSHQDQLVAVDVTSTYPESVKENATDLGHVRNLSVEAILQEKPTQIFALKNDLSEDLTSKLNNLNIPIHYYQTEYSAKGAKELIKKVAADLGEETPKEVTETIDSELQNLATFKNEPRVLFVYARGAGTLLVAGKTTPVAKMIALSGGKNAIDSFDDYRPLTTEAVAKANPDVLLFFKSGLQSVGGLQGVKKIQGLAETEAAKKEQIIAMDGLLLTSFGPRTGKAANILNSKLNSYAK